MPYIIKCIKIAPRMRKISHFNKITLKKLVLTLTQIWSKNMVSLLQAVIFASTVQG